MYHPFTEIITVVYNQLKYTEAMLNSLYRNTDPKKFRLIVIDSGSDKKTKDFLKKYKFEAPNMELIITNKNIGWCRGLNLGFKQLKSDSDYVLWCNNDVLFESDWLEKMIAHFKGSVGAVGPSSNYVLGRQWAHYNWGHYEEEAPWLIGFCLMFRREIINIVGDVDERFGLGGSEEWDYQIRMNQDCGMGSVIARDIYCHHFGSKTLWNQAGGTSDGYNEYIKEKDKVLREKWGDQVIDAFVLPRQKQVLVGVPHPGSVHHKFWRDWLFLKSPYGMEVMEVVKTSAIHDARNVIAQKAMEENFRYLMFMDSDMRIPPNVMLQLMQHKVPIVAGNFVARSYPYFPCSFKYDEEKKGYLSVYETGMGLRERDAVGAACTLIDVKVLKAMAADKKKKGLNPFDFFYWGQYGEDVSFCYEARKLGFKIFCDTDLEILHITDEQKEVGMKDYAQKEEKC